LVDEIDTRIIELFGITAKEKGIELLAVGTLLDHAHLLVGLTADQELPWAVQMFKGISSRKIFQEFRILKTQLKTDSFWARRYGSKEVSPENIARTKAYILNQKKDFCVI